MARRLTDLTSVSLPLDKSEIILVQQAGVDKKATVQNVLDVGYLSSDFDTDFVTNFATRDTDDLTEGSANKYFFSHNNTYHIATYLISTDITYELLDTNGDIGTGTGQLLTSTDITYELLDTNGDIGTSAGQVSIGDHNHSGIYEPIFSKNTGFNKDLGTSSGTVSEGDHAHGDIYYTETESDAKFLLNTTDEMTGTLTVDTINISSVNPADTATIFGSTSGSDSTMHIRIGNGAEDKIQFESWNGASATSLIEVGQTYVTILGDLNVSGTTTTIDSTTVDIADNEITLNSNVTGSPTLNASLIINRGTSNDAAIRWNETGIWDLTPGTGSYSEIMTVSTSDARYALESNNLSDLDSASTARTNLGLGSSAIINAASANTASTVVSRDGSGNFSAGTITATLTGTASNAALLDNYNSAEAATASTVAVRDSSRDITARLFRSDTTEVTQTKPAATSDIAFRINSSTNNYIRFMDKASMKLYMGIDSGSGTFQLTPNAATVIGHSLGTALFNVSITPTLDSGGYLGEIYVLLKTTTQFSVYKTGSASGVTFDWMAMET